MTSRNWVFGHVMTSLLITIIDVFFFSKIRGRVNYFGTNLLILKALCFNFLLKKLIFSIPSRLITLCFFWNIISTYLFPSPPHPWNLHITEHYIRILGVLIWNKFWKKVFVFKWGDLSSTSCGIITKFCSFSFIFRLFS